MSKREWKSIYSRLRGGTCQTAGGDNRPVEPRDLYHVAPRDVVDYADDLAQTPAARRASIWPLNLRGKCATRTARGYDVDWLVSNERRFVRLGGAA